MNKIAHYLQEHLLGEVTSAADVRRHYSDDASILQIQPTLVVYPANEDDVRKTVRFSWQLAERGKKLPVTARGHGSNTSGAAIGSGVILVFPAHMNDVLMLNTKKRSMILQPGINYRTLEQTLYTHGLCLPPYPASQNYTTLGGAIANNAIGEKSVKYGSVGNYVQSLRVVLANGEIIETGMLSKKELNHKMGLQTLEGDIYRSLDTLIEENFELIAYGRKHVKSRHNAAGYNIYDVKKDKHFDLTPLFVGSQGSLGVITEATLELSEYRPKTTQALVSLDEYLDLQDILPRILELKPSMLDLLNRAAINKVLMLNPNQLVGVSKPDAFMHLFVEFDDPKDADQKKKVKALQKAVEKIGVWSEVYDNEKRAQFQKLRDCVAILLQPQEPATAIPFVEDVSVPPDRLAEFLQDVEKIHREVDLPACVWGQAGSGVVRMWPVLDLSNTGDRQKLFKIMGSILASAVRLGGSISAAAGDGRIRAPYSPLVYGPEVHELMLNVKKIFDPHNILNPGVKTASTEEVKALLRTQYSLSNFYDYLPRS